MAILESLEKKRVLQAQKCNKTNYMNTMHITNTNKHYHQRVTVVFTVLVVRIKHPEDGSS